MRTARSSVTVSFDATNPAAAEWARKRSAQLIVGITNQTRSAIRKVMHRAFIEHIPPRQAAKLIVPLIGLTEDQADRILDLRGEILASPGKKIWLGRKGIRVPDDPTDDFVSRKLADYADRLLDTRAMTIARTETIAASNEGQREMWEQAVEEGDLPENALREWIVTPDDRLCPICEPMDGVTTGIGEPFELEDGTKVQGPPAHPNCRCGQGISEEVASRAAEFDPDQPRDESGQWTSSGRGLSAGEREFVNKYQESSFDGGLISTED